LDTRHEEEEEELEEKEDLEETLGHRSNWTPRMDICFGQQVVGSSAGGWVQLVSGGHFPWDKSEVK